LRHGNQVAGTERDVQFAVQRRDVVVMANGQAGFCRQQPVLGQFGAGAAAASSPVASSAEGLINAAALLLQGHDAERIALALVTLGLYIASSLLMQHAVGPKWGGMPLLALVGYVLAIRFTFSIARGRARR